MNECAVSGSAPASKAVAAVHDSSEPVALQVPVLSLVTLSVWRTVCPGPHSLGQTLHHDVADLIVSPRPVTDGSVRQSSTSVIINELDMFGRPLMRFVMWTDCVDCDSSKTHHASLSCKRVKHIQ